ncbi:hypothetical protein SF12_03145 [Streptomyces sp. MBRL 601]|nr:hypothetical protein SF12_03145 [Streptomyces sp. MBRL 601]
MGHRVTGGGEVDAVRPERAGTGRVLQHLGEGGVQVGEEGARAAASWAATALYRRSSALNSATGMPGSGAPPIG